MTSRSRLPTRRKNRTLNVVFGGCPYDVTIGTYADGRLGEIFVHGAKIGSAMDLQLGDIAIVLSIAMQHGLDPLALVSSMGRFHDGSPAIALGALLDALPEEITGNRGVYPPCEAS